MLILSYTGISFINDVKISINKYLLFFDNLKKLTLTILPL